MAPGQSVRAYPKTSTRPLTGVLAVPSYATIKNNEIVKIQCVDWSGYSSSHVVTSF